MFGKKGKTDKIVLDSGKSNFQRASNDMFGMYLSFYLKLFVLISFFLGIEEADIGELEKIIVGHDNSVFLYLFLKIL